MLSTKDTSLTLIMVMLKTEPNQTKNIAIGRWSRREITRLHLDQDLVIMHVIKLFFRAETGKC